MKYVVWLGNLSFEHLMLIALNSNHMAIGSLIDQHKSRANPPPILTLPTKNTFHCLVSFIHSTLYYLKLSYLFIYLHVYFLSPSYLLWSENCESRDLIQRFPSKNICKNNKHWHLEYPGVQVNIEPLVWLYFI